MLKCSPLPSKGFEVSFVLPYTKEIARMRVLDAKTEQEAIAASESFFTLLGYEKKGQLPDNE